MNILNAPLLIGILVLCAVFSHTCLTVGILLNINSVTDRTHHIHIVCFKTHTHMRHSVYAFLWLLEGCTVHCYRWKCKLLDVH